MDTLLLERGAWDLCLDSLGNIAVASSPYALAQDAASAIRTYQAECWYDTTLGVPYFQQILGKLPPAAVLKAAFTQAALTVPEVAGAKVFLTALDPRTRLLGGQVQVTTALRSPGNGASAPVVAVSSFTTDFSGDFR